jgi:hypothetical protein
MNYGVRAQGTGDPTTIRFVIHDMENNEVTGFMEVPRKQIKWIAECMMEFIPYPANVDN